MKKVYFICIGNSGRSQMAEGFARELGKGILEARSGGTKPAPQVSHKAIEVMKELHIDISMQRPKQLELNYAKTSDLVIIMGCGAEKMCPAWVVSKSENWDLEDPKGQEISVYRKVRDSIKEKIEELIERAKKNEF